MPRILTGIQSTGTPHLGNLLGAIIPAISLSKNKNKIDHKILISKGYMSSINEDLKPSLNTKQYTISEALTLLNLPKVEFKNNDHILLSDCDIIKDTQVSNIHELISKHYNKLTNMERGLVDKCIDYYKKIYPTQSLFRDLLLYTGKLNNIIRFIYKFQNYYMRDIKKDDFVLKKTMSLEEALHKLNLPSFKSDKVIHFRNHVDKVSLNADELNLVELCDDYYNGI